MRPAILALTLAGLCGPALAFEADGVTIEIPAGYTADHQSHPDFTVAIGVQPPAAGGPRVTGFMGVADLCAGGLAAEAAFAGQTQDTLNALVADPGTPALMKQAYLPATFTNEANLSIDGVSWYEFVAKLEAEPAILVFVSFTLIPAGVLALSCAAYTEEFDAALPVFQTVRDTMKGPSS